MGKPYVCVCVYKLLVTCSVKNFPKVQMFNDINTQGARPITSNLVPRSWNVIGEASWVLNLNWLYRQSLHFDMFRRG